MVQTNPIPRKPNRYLQVFISVLSGVAAMYCIQNFVSAPEPRTASSAPKAAAPEPTGVPETTAPPAVDDVERPLPKVPVENAMLVVPEAGGTGAGVVAVYGEAPNKSAAAPAKAAAKTGAGPAKKNVPIIHLEHRALPAAYSGPSVGHDFQPAQLTPISFAKNDAIPASPALAAPAEAPPATPLKFYTTVIDKKPIPRKDIFVPSELHPEILPEKSFWDSERRRKGLISGLIALAGGLYMAFGTGLINVGKQKYEDDEPRA